MVQHVTGKLFPQEHDTSCLFQILVPTHYRSVNQSCLVQVHMIKFASNMGIGFSSASHRKQCTFYLTENISSTEEKRDGTQFPNGAHAPRI